MFLVPIQGGRWHIIPQLAVSTTYILPSGGLYATYHLLWEPETTIEVGNPTIDNLFGSLDVDSALSMPTRPMTFVFPFLIWERSEFATRCRINEGFLFVKIWWNNTWKYIQYYLYMYMYQYSIYIYY